MRMLRRPSLHTLTLSSALAAGALAFAPSSARADGLPPITSASDAVAQLSLTVDAQVRSALKNLRAACQGDLRHELRDHKEVLARLRQIIGSATPATKKAVLETEKCFTPPRFVDLVTVGLSDAHPMVVAAAAEAAARVSDPVMALPLLDARDKRIEACTKPGLQGHDLDACVWLAYAPSTLITGMDKVTRERAGEQSLKLLESVYPKVRDVSVETITATRLQKYQKEIEKLIAREEKEGGFEQPNPPAMVKRFKMRANELKKGEK